MYSIRGKNKPFMRFSPEPAHQGKYGYSCKLKAPALMSTSAVQRAQNIGDCCDRITRHFIYIYIYIYIYIIHI
jgi:hypothetical protein